MVDSTASARVPDASGWIWCPSRLERVQPCGASGSVKVVKGKMQAMSGAFFRASRPLGAAWGQLPSIQLRRPSLMLCQLVPCGLGRLKYSRFASVCGHSGRASNGPLANCTWAMSAVRDPWAICIWAIRRFPGLFARVPMGASGEDARLGLPPRRTSFLFLSYLRAE